MFFGAVRPSAYRPRLGRRGTRRSTLCLCSLSSTRLVAPTRQCSRLCAKKDGSRASSPTNVIWQCSGLDFERRCSSFGLESTAIMGTAAPAMRWATSTATIMPHASARCRRHGWLRHRHRCRLAYPLFCRVRRCPRRWRKQYSQRMPSTVGVLL